MQTLKSFRITTTLCFGLMLFIASPAFAAEISWNQLSGDSTAHSIVIAAADAEVGEPGKPESGTLVLPAATEKKEAEKKCMTVCQKWGQDCVYDNQRGRKCRRTCKQFGQECF